MNNFKIGERVEIHTKRGFKNVPIIYRGVIVGLGKGGHLIIKRDDIVTYQKFHHSVVMREERNSEQTKQD